ncbi:ABC transporter substrate-binding protein [Belnapia sp. T6]|uniref:ABC transporter substrate-binding protein n=1 Tax=Belnapia mucosa TaxID=2804532 RepID=A0ABS1V7T2_9PROT|nr:ABC transporter substrate-binding protein [Belnapia mucosa]MBL6457725.1 ABC transporter substrate-binding protein [Belnapia mucosa]
MPRLTRRTLPSLAAGLLASPALAQGIGSRTLRFVPSTDLFSLDFIWSSSSVALTASLMVYDCLYGLDPQLVAQPQMVAGHDLSDDGLRWTFTLREGLRFTTGEPVTGADCVASIARWAQRRPIGQRMTPLVEEMRGLDDRRFEIRLKRPFPQMLRGLTEPWIMPERIAKTSAFTEVKEIVGSGPFTFLKEEWISGASAAFRRNEAYVPRSEPPAYLAGGKVAHFDRVEWVTMPDPASASAALQRGEVEYMDRPLFDLMPRLRRAPGLKLHKTDALGWSAYLHFNNGIPPFDNVALRRAVLAAIDQAEFMQAAVGNDASLYTAGTGLFTPGSPFETKAGQETLPPRDTAVLRRLVQESGYKGEKVVLMVPSDSPHLNAMGLVAAQVMAGIGLNVDAQIMDLATLFTRWRSRDRSESTNWHCFPLSWQGVGTATPAAHVPLLGQAPDPEMVALIEAWFQAPDFAAQKAGAEAIQRRYYANPPFAIMGSYVWPVAYRSNIQGALEAPFTVFWNLRKG